MSDVFCISFSLVWAHSVGAQAGMWVSKDCGYATVNGALTSENSCFLKIR